MRMQELISDILDLLGGQLNQPEETTVIVARPTATIAQPKDASPLTHAGDDINRWRQIVDLADTDGSEPYGNSPKERYADLNSVTSHAGGGVNGPKHPDDLRGNSLKIYPSENN